MNGIVIEWSFAERDDVLEARRLMPDLRPGDAMLLISFIGGAAGRRLGVRFPGGVASRLGVGTEYLNRLIDTLCEVNLLERDGDFIFSPYLEEKVRVISERNSNNAKGSGGKRPKATESDRMPSQATASDPSYLSYPILSKDLKENSPPSPPPKFTTPHPDEGRKQLREFVWLDDFHREMAVKKLFEWGFASNRYLDEAADLLDRHYDKNKHKIPIDSKGVFRDLTSSWVKTELNKLKASELKTEESKLRVDRQKAINNGPRTYPTDPPPKPRSITPSESSVLKTLTGFDILKSVGPK